MDKLISQQAAIDTLKELTANGTNKGMVFGEDAVHRIEMLPSAQPDTTTHDSIPAETGENDGDGTSGDCISRQRSVDTLRKMQTYKLFAGDDMLLIDQAEAQTELMMLPSAQPEPRTAYWTKDIVGSVVCSNCGGIREDNRIGHTQWCNCCGCFMRGEEND